MKERQMTDEEFTQAIESFTTTEKAFTELATAITAFVGLATQEVIAIVDRFRAWAYEHLPPVANEGQVVEVCVPGEDHLHCFYFRREGTEWVILTDGGNKNDEICS